MPQRSLASLIDFLHLLLVGEILVHHFHKETPGVDRAQQPHWCWLLFKTWERRTARAGRNRPRVKTFSFPGERRAADAARRAPDRVKEHRLVIVVNGGEL
ncbi:hypothetical protein J6590_059653 [Homalodisca vitripennis]|nr:hypothetical protein J6590_059653 [Homalodisca vitripennis]